MLNPSPDTGIDSIFKSTSRVDVSVMTTAEPPLLSTTTLPPPSIPIISHVQQTPTPSPANVLSSSLQDLPNFGSLFGFDHRLKTLKTNFSEFMQTNQFAEAISSILGIVDKYLDHWMNEAKIIKEQVKEKVKVQVSKILPKIEKTINEQLEAEILIDKMESNKSIHISYEQKNLYKALIDTCECDKLILNTYEDTVTFNRRRDDEDKDEEPSAGSNRGSKRRRAGKKNQIQPVHQRKRHPRHLASQLKGPNLTTRLLASLHQQRSQCTLPKIWKNSHIRSLRQVQLTINLLKRLLSILTGDFKKLRIQDIKDMLLLLVQGKFTNLTVDEHFAFNVSLRMFTRSIVIQRRVKDLQLGVKSYQKKLNLTKPDTYRSDLKRKEAYTTYFNPEDSSTKTKTSITD
nr:hypothetical protein [Tanacetum cinerariifolium]